MIHFQSCGVDGTDEYHSAEHAAELELVVMENGQPPPLT